MRREDLKCTFCGITTEMLHYLFGCAALSGERRKLNDKTGQLCPSFPALINEISKNSCVEATLELNQYRDDKGVVYGLKSQLLNLANVAMIRELLMDLSPYLVCGESGTRESTDRSREVRRAPTSIAEVAPVEESLRGRQPGRHGLFAANCRLHGATRSGKTVSTACQRPPDILHRYLEYPTIKHINDKAEGYSHNIDSLYKFNPENFIMQRDKPKLRHPLNKESQRLAPGFHRRVKAKTSLQDEDVPIYDTTTNPLFTPQEKGRNGTREKVPRLRWNPWQKHVRFMMVETRSGKMQDPAQERIKAEESAKPQPGATIGRDASSDPVVLNPNIDIPKYDGTEDPRPWIESLEEIGFLYHWADYIISRYAAMNMIGSAKTWLNLHKVSFTSWENFKSRLIEDFASDANKEEMRMRLNRIQQWNEPAIRFAEDILVLCNKVDPQMEEETKINWVIGGLKKEYSFALHLNPPKNTNELLEICKKLDLFEKNYQERAEKSKALYNGPRSPRPHHQEQWKNATSFRRPYQNTSKPQAPAPRYYQNTSKPQAPTPRYYQNKPLPQVSAPRRSYTPNPEPKPVYPSKTYNKNPNSNRNRTEDGRPICFKCNKPGHVARYCRVRFVRIVEEDPIVTQDKVEEEIRMDNGTQKSRPLLYSDVSNSPYSSIPTRNRYAALEDLN
ncbi:ASPRV1 [Cordylochernes scorpioides]|uniref:ASPRV1 n=1 Tax=Cordylochernes scorpioides TaxID=51811 RepID=A0ABY6LQ57_9ARAC|nr:ASPRV1 [Cordylochernes scorpioides]